MNDLLKNWMSSHEILKVRENRRKRLCQALTYIGSFFLLIFGVLCAIKQFYLLTVILLGSAIVGCINAYLLHRSNNIKTATNVLTLVLFVLIFSLIMTGGMEGTGMLWVYPIFAILLFINKFNRAVILSLIVILLSSILLFTPFSGVLEFKYYSVQAIRFIMTLIALDAICLTAIYSEENAYKMIMRLHADDIHRLAFYDSLTGLPNRWTLQNNLHRLLERRQDDDILAVLYIDLDNFKHVNDNFGHEVGDRLLSRFAEQLYSIIRPGDILTKEHHIDVQTDDVARLAGDEFVLILTNLNNPLEATNVARRILDLFKNGFRLDDNTYSVYASIGIAICPDDSVNSEELLRYADAAMYKAKSRHSNSFEYFTNDIAEYLDTNQKIENGLKSAIESDQFSLVYLPMYSCENREIVGIEALIRCNESSLDGHGPDEFIPVAESTGLIREIDQWVLNKSVEDFISIRKSTGFDGKLSVNISAIELFNEDFPKQLESILKRSALPEQIIELEITETSLVSDSREIKNVLADLISLGVSLSLDDFGTGYTAFNQLILYPASALKIDRSFVKEISSSSSSQAKLVEVFRNLAHIYELRVIAEGVETEQQFDYLKSIGCDWVQGYYFSGPVAKEELIKMLAS